MRTSNSRRQVSTHRDGQPAGGIRASDAERDATVERLSRAAGDGRLTLDEFSQRMEQATAARTRAELGRLVADLPAEPAVAGAVAAPASAPATWHVSPVGGLRVSGPWRMARHVIVASIVGGTWLDLSEAQLAAPEVTLTTVSLVGGTRIMVPPGIRVEASGFSLVGGTRVEGGPEPGPGAPTVYIRAFSLVGGVRIQRSGPRGDRGPRGDWRAEREDRRTERRDWRAERRAGRRSRRDRPGYSFGQARASVTAHSAPLALQGKMSERLAQRCVALGREQFLLDRLGLPVRDGLGVGPRVPRLTGGSLAWAMLAVR